MERLQSQVLFCKQAEEDYNADIINSLIQIDRYNKITDLILVQDIDLLVILNQLNSNNYGIFIKI